MNSIELSKHNSGFSSPCFKSTFHLTSARKSDDADDSTLDTHALASSYASSSVACLDFDAIKLNFYPPSPVRNTPCSVDALTFEWNGTFLVEFKFVTAAIENITRKIYDSVMLLVEHDGYTFGRARRELTYIVVSTGIQNHMGAERSLSRGKAYCRETWKQFRKMDDHWKLASLDGVIVKEAYGMHPATFDYYAKLKHWI